MKKSVQILALALTAAMLAGCNSAPESSAPAEIAAITEATTTAAETTTTSAETTTAPEPDLPEETTAPETEKTEQPTDNTYETKPVENTDPSKVVNPSLVGHEYQNPDGTYSAEHVAGITIPGTNEEMTDYYVKVLKERGKGKSNPSKIPYSEITVENAAEAFPYLGDFIGYVPDYIEIFPDMTREEIELAIGMNFNGLPPMNAETHEHYLYSSAEAWEAELARREENRKWQEETGKRAEEAVADKDQKIGDGSANVDDLTDEQKQQLDDLFNF
ncbi:MAG: hypothetical protein ACI4KM_10115 [Oscillospiraceae bacterium]